jgi:hypothetical protein
MFTREQADKVKAKRAAEQAAQVPAQPPPRVEAPPRTAEPRAPATAPTGAAAVPDYRLTLGTILTLHELTMGMAGRGIGPTPELPFAALTLAAMMLTDPLFATVTRERFVELAAAAYDHAEGIAPDERRKGL